jgi:hypothetical protein
MKKARREGEDVVEETKDAMFSVRLYTHSLCVLYMMRATIGIDNLWPPYGEMLNALLMQP